MNTTTRFEKNTNERVAIKGRSCASHDHVARSKTWLVFLDPEIAEVDEQVSTRCVGTSYCSLTAAVGAAHHLALPGATR